MIKKVKKVSLLAVLALLSLTVGLFAGGDDPEETGFKIQPALQIPSPSSISMMWESHNADIGKIKISTNSNMSNARELSTVSGKIHKITVDGLSANTRYYYTVETEGKNSGVKSFITALPSGSRESFRFAVYGDTRRAHWAEDIVSKYGDNDDHLPVVQSMASYAPDFLLGVGDYSYDGNDMSDIYNFFSVEKDLLSNYPLIPAYGNHEFKKGSNTGNTLMDSFFIPKSGGNFAYWSYDYGNVHIVVLNTGHGVWPGDNYDVIKPGSAQWNWAKGDMEAAAANPNVDHIFVAFHNPLFSVANFGDFHKIQDALEGLFKDNGVKIVFYGHEHDYQHLEKDGVHYVLAGGGGSPIFDLPLKKSRANLIKYDDVLNYILVDVNGRNLSIEARSVQGQGNSASARLETFSL